MTTEDAYSVTRLRPTPGPHTPGPWSVVGEQANFAGYLLTSYNDQRHIYSAVDKKSGGTGCVAVVASSSANAHLIAAAPELLAALQTCRNVLAGIAVGDLDTVRPDSRALAAARAAIAKAQGE